MNADLIVVGAGVIGAAAARIAADAGADVLVVDDADPAAATGAGAGLVCPALVDDVPAPVAELLRLTGDALPELLADLPEGRGAARRGLLVLDDRSALESLAAAVTARRDAGVPFVGDVALLDGPAARDLVALAAGAGAALHLPGAVQISGPVFAAEQLAAAGARATLLRRRVTAVDEVDGGVVVRTAEDDLSAGRVILAAGARSGLLPELRDDWMIPSRGQQLVVGVGEAEWPDSAPAVMSGRHYAFSDEPGVLRVGATHEHGETEAVATDEGVAELTAALDRLTGRAASLPIRGTLVGIRAVSADGVPVVGRVPGREHVLMANGLGPFGLMAGTAVSRLVADLALDREPALDPAPFDPARWGR